MARAAYDTIGSSPSKAIEQARAALAISHQCPDAYALLARLEAKTLQEALDFYERGAADYRKASRDCYLGAAALSHCIAQPLRMWVIPHHDTWLALARRTLALYSACKISAVVFCIIRCHIRQTPSHFHSARE